MVQTPPIHPNPHTSPTDPTPAHSTNPPIESSPRMDNETGEHSDASTYDVSTTTHTNAAVGTDDVSMRIPVNTAAGTDDVSMTTSADDVAFDCVARSRCRPAERSCRCDNDYGEGAIPRECYKALPR